MCWCTGRTVTSWRVAHRKARPALQWSVRLRAEQYLVRMHADVGTGDASLLLFTGETAPSWGSALDRATLSEALAQQRPALRAAGWHLEGNMDRLRVGARAVRGRDVDVAAGTCARFGVSVGSGLPDIQLELRRGSQVPWSPKGLARERRCITRCASVVEHLHLLEASLESSGPGEYLMWRSGEILSCRSAGSEPARR